ncbi:hypothetical protein MRX96_025243 [Rhipicephalus microplus]
MILAEPITGKFLLPHEVYGKTGTVFSAYSDGRNSECWKDCRVSASGRSTVRAYYWHGRQSKRNTSAWHVRTDQRARNLWSVLLMHHQPPDSSSRIPAHCRFADTRPPPSNQRWSSVLCGSATKLARDIFSSLPQHRGVAIAKLHCRLRQP